MNATAQGTAWKEIVQELTKEFMAWGCPYSRRKLPEIAMGYDCTPLFFWNWMDDPEVDKSERGFLRVLGYAWRKYLREEADHVPQPVRAAASAPVKTSAGKAA